MNRGYSNLTWCLTLILLAAAPAIVMALNEPFYLEVVRRALILSIAVVSLDLLVGYCGMISLGHAAFLGLGSYAVGVLTKYGVHDGILQFVVAMVAAAVFSLIVGSVSLRVRGAYFIMITLAFAQLAYFFFISLTVFGGDDGMILYARSEFPFVDLYNEIALYYLVFGVFLLVLFFLYKLVRSRFGKVLEGIRQNERRMAAVGISVYRYQLTAFVIAGTICGLAGALLANHDEFVSPATMHWTWSGDLLVMAIIGGVGTLLGAVWGSLLYVFLEVILSGYSRHWHLVFGPCLVILALVTRRGLLDLRPTGRRNGAAGNIRNSMNKSAPVEAK